jgi:hypothetical protein
MNERQPRAAALVAQHITRLDTVDVHLHTGSLKGTQWNDPLRGAPPRLHVIYAASARTAATVCASDRIRGSFGGLLETLLRFEFSRLDVARIGGIGRIDR